MEFRQLISELFENNLDKFISCYPDPDILGEKEPEINEEILNFLKKYSNYIKQPNVYAGDQEIALTSYFFGININVLIINYMGYILIFPKTIGGGPPVPQGGGPPTPPSGTEQLISFSNNFFN